MSSHLPARTPPPPPPDLAYQTYGPMDDLPAQASPIQIQRLLAFLRKLWWIPILTLLLSLGAAAAFVLWAPPTFVSTSAIWETEKLRLPEGAAFIGDVQNYYGTQMELLLSGRLHQMGLARLQASGTNAVPLDEDRKPLKVKVTVKQQPKSTIFVLQSSSPNPDYSQAFLDALVNEYLAYKKNVRKLVSGDTLSSISEQVLRLERELKADQEALTTFQRSNNLAILQEEGTIAGGYLARLQTQLSDLKLESQLLEATAIEQDQAAATGNTNAPGSLLDAVRAAGSGSSSPAVTEHQIAYKEVELLKIQREKLSKHLRPKHPKIAKLDSDIERGQRIVQLYRNQSREQLTTSRQALKMKSDSVQATIKEWQSKVVEANSRIAEADRLKLSITRSQSLYDRLVLLLQNVDISRNIDQETIAVLEPASTAQRSYRQEIMVFGLALVAGLGLGLGLIFLVAVRDDRFTSPTEVNEHFAGSVVGQVPEVRAPKPKGALPLLAQDDPRHTYAESYRNLRSALLFLPLEGFRPKIVLVTSAVPNEGKSTIAANLAETLALGGARVLLVDGDLRKGRLHEVLGLQAGPGLAEVLAGSTPLEQALQTNCRPNLSFLGRGSNVKNPGDAFLSPELDRILARWREQFDFVVIDSCPVFAADDAATLANKVDGTLFVVRRRFSRSRVVREALELLGQRQARILGVVFNRADASAGSYYYYKHAEYYSSAKTA
ncbi:MAG: polysaccharide biosynthesis tyrosine autokinase [Verrucomicrobiota bacterium]